ncbi:MAG: methyltransferase [Clostridia bacterium]|nr:methyltransferase [Clostridia bacterium]
MAIRTQILGIDLVLETSKGLFSPGSVDRGTLAMLSCAAFRPGEHILDLGCGYGVVGIVAAKLAGEAGVVMLDNDPAAVAVAARNAVGNGVAGIRTLVSDGLSGLDDAGYDWILSNPPYHADFTVARKFIEKGFNRLRIGGRMLMVTKRRDWYQNKFIAVFGGVRISEIDGYFVFLAEKRQESYAGKNR